MSMKIETDGEWTFSAHWKSAAGQKKDQEERTEKECNSQLCLKQNLGVGTYAFWPRNKA